MSEAQTGNLQTSRGTIVQVDVKEATGAKGPYKLHSFTLNTGKTFKLFGTNKSDLPSLDKKEIEGLVEGADVIVAESRNGKYMNVIGVDVLPSSRAVTTSDVLPRSGDAPQTQTEVQKTINQSGTFNVPVSQATSGALSTPSDRDASIVVQAMLKSLIEGMGNAYLREKTTEDGTTYLNINRAAIRSHAKELLAIHDSLVRIRTGKTDETSETKE